MTFRDFVAAAALCLALSGPAMSQTAPPASRLDDILARGALKVGMTGDYRPFTSLDKTTGKFEGFDVEMAESLGKALGVKVEFVPTTWSNLMKDFEAGAFDMAMGGVSITLDRAKKGYFSTPIMREGKTPIARCADKGKFEELSQIDRPDVRVVVNPGGTNERFARSAMKNAPITVHPDNTTIFKEIAEGRADVMMTDASETLFQQKQNPGVLCAVHPEKPFDFAEKGYWIQRDQPLKEFVDQWLHIQKETGAFQATSAKYFN
jgi:cyclohexadienyl dehydratase